MDDREIQQWDKRLADQVKRDWDNYKHLHIDLSVARQNEPFGITGEFLYVEESSSADAIAKIKLNRNTNDALDLEKSVEIETVFIEVYITNDALQDEWLDLVFGINFKYKKKIYNVFDDLFVNGNAYFDGVILALGTAGATPVSGGGTRFMWIPAKKALRAGTAFGDGWDDANIGSNSVAFGEGAIASGAGSFAAGSQEGGAGCVASGVGSISLGRATLASGEGSRFRPVLLDWLYVAGKRELFVC